MSSDGIYSFVSLNIWNRQGSWPRRRVLLHQELKSLGADVVGLQEVVHNREGSQAELLAKAGGYEVAFGAARVLEDGAQYGNAILSRFPIVEQKLYDLPCLGVDEPRTMLAVRLQTPDGVLPVLVTHLSWRFEHGFVREQQALAIARAIDQEATRADDALPLVLLGDLNAGPDSTEIRFLKGLHALEGRSMYLADCFGETGTGDGFTFDGRTNPFAAGWHERPRRIDYVMVRGPELNGRGKPLSAKLICTEFEGDLAPTDHYGVHATIRMA